MTPIISPQIVYFIGIVDQLKSFLFVISFILLFICGLIVFYLSQIPDNDKEEKASSEATLRKFFFYFILYTTINIFIPSKETTIAMVVAKEVTYERVEKAAILSKDLKAEIKKDIIDIIKEVNSNDDNRKK